MSCIRLFDPWSKFYELPIPDKYLKTVMENIAKIF